MCAGAYKHQYMYIRVHVGEATVFLSCVCHLVTQRVSDLGSAPVVWRYDPPVVTRMHPQTGATNASNADGTPVLIEVT